MGQADWIFPEPFPEEELALPRRTRLRRGFPTRRGASGPSWLSPKGRASPGVAQARLVSVSRMETVKRP